MNRFPLRYVLRLEGKMLRFACPHCGNEIRCPDSTAGQMGTCLKCKGPIRAPQPTDNVWVPDGVPIRRQPPPPSMVAHGFKAGVGGAMGVATFLILAPFVLLFAFILLGALLR